MGDLVRGSRVPARALLLGSMAAAALTNTSASAGTAVVASSCIGTRGAGPELERMALESLERGPLQVYVREVTCSDDACTIGFDLISTEPGCAIDRRAILRDDSNLARGGDADFGCHVPRGDCPTLSGEPSFDASRPELARCLERATAVAARTLRCERMDPISDPVAPPPAPPMRFGFDLGGGWRFGAAPQQRPLLALGISADWRVVPAIAVGARFGYAAAAGDAVDRDGDGRRETNTANLHALEPALRVRLRLGDADRRLEIESSLGYRLLLSTDAANHPTAGVGATLYLSRFGLGVHYVRSLQDSILRDAVFIMTERNTPLDMDTRAAYPGSTGHGLPRIGLGLHAIAGWGFAKHLGPMLPGAAIELPISFGGPLTVVGRYDVLWFPGLDANAIVAQTVLGGLEYLRIGALPFGVGALAGHAIAAGTAPRVVDGGPVVDGGVWYWLDDLGLHLGVNGRLGVTERNRELRAVYVSFGARQIF